MALPSSGVMKASMIRAELGQTSGPWSINAASSRKLAEVPSGTIKFSDFYGKTLATFFQFANQTNNTTQEGGGSCYRQYDFNVDASSGNSITLGVNCNFHWRRSQDHGGTSWCEEWIAYGNLSSFKAEYTTNGSDGGMTAPTQSDPGVVNISSIDTVKAAQGSCTFNKNNIGSNWSEVYSKTIRTDVGQWYIKFYAMKSGNTVTCRVQFQMLNTLNDGWRTRCRLSWYIRAGVAVYSLTIYSKLKSYFTFHFFKCLINSFKGGVKEIWQLV